MGLLSAAEVAVAATGAMAAPPPPAQIEFFEKSVRPVLVDHCYKCHSDGAAKLQGGLKLDSPARMAASETSLSPPFNLAAPSERHL